VGRHDKVITKVKRCCDDWAGSPGGKDSSLPSPENLRSWEVHKGKKGKVGVRCYIGEEKKSGSVGFKESCHEIGVTREAEVHPIKKKLGEELGGKKRVVNLH